MTLEPSLSLALDAETWSTPVLADDRVVAADRSGRVRAWNGSGEVVWEVRLDSEITASPTLTSLSDPTILIGDHEGSFVALDLASGRELWRQRLGARIRATAAVAEVEGELSIFVPVYGPRLVRLSASGDVVYDRALPKNEIYQRGQAAGAVSSPLVADIDGDGSLEVVFGVRAQRVYCCDAASGEIRWFRPLRYDPDSSPSLAMDGERPIVLVGGGEHTGGAGDNAMIALDPGDGNILWYAPADGGVDGAATVADVNGDGVDEIVFCSLASGSVHVADTQGRSHWSVAFGPTDNCVHDPDCRVPEQPYFTGRATCRSYVTPLVADLDGDGRQEIVAGANNGRLLVLDGATGREKGRLETDGMVRGSPVLADINGNGRCELVVPSGDRLLVFPTDALPPEAWPQTKGEATHLGWRRPRPVRANRKAAQRLVGPRLAWHSTGRDALRYAAFQVERRVLNPLGIRIAEYYY